MAQRTAKKQRQTESGKGERAILNFEFPIFNERRQRHANSKLGIQNCPFCPAPKGLRNKAQGCADVGATLGMLASVKPTPKGLKI
jgi:hypothetical protein